MSVPKAITYAEEFKRSSAQLAIESEQSINRTAKDLGLNSSTLYTWVEKYYPSTNKSTISSSLSEELKALRKELTRVKQERDILKKASAYFASQM
jgi:transposase